MSDQQDESEIRSAIHFAVIQICAQEETHTKTKITSQALHALSELTYLYATTSLRDDLNVFATHAGRKTINESDVKLVARKNPDNLLDRLNQYAQEHFVAAAPKVAAVKPRKTETFFNLDKDATLSSSEDEVLGNPSKKVAARPLPPPTDSSMSYVEGDERLKLPARPPRKQTTLSIHDDDSSDSSIEGIRPNKRIASVQPSYSAGGSRIRNILDQLSQDSFENNREDIDMQE